MLAPILYIAGPDTGVDGYKKLFERAADVLRFNGYETRNPATFALLCRTPEPSWHDYMRHCLRTIAQVDGVALLDGWEDSRGAAWEKRIATEVLAIPCLPVAEWVELGGMMP